MRPRTRSRRSSRPVELRRPWRPFLELLEARLAPANVDFLAYHNDPFLSGQNLQEDTLTPANVNPTNFGKLFSIPVDGYVYAEPLYKADFTIAGGKHNVAFVATQHDSVYALDADNPTAGPNGNGVYWQRSFIDPVHGVTTVPSPSEISNSDIVPEIGITGTPVIDGKTDTLYVVAKTKEVRGGTAHYVQKLHALDLATGAERPNSLYQIGDTVFGGPDGGFTDVTDIVVNGRGDGADSGGHVRFNAARENNRSALQLTNGVVYVAFAAHSDYRPYHGWLIGFDGATLQPVRVFNTAPNAGGVGIWQSGGAVSVDPDGNLYFAVGNGFAGPNAAFDPAHGNYSESVLKLSASGQLTVADYFTPFDWQTLDQRDADLGSGGVMLLPDGVGSAAHPHLMVETGKSGKIYLIDRDNLGQFRSGGPDRVVQITTAGQTGVWGNPTFYQIDPADGIIYYHGSGDVVKGYYVSNGHVEDGSRTGDRPILRSPQATTMSGFPGTQPVISANGIDNPAYPVNGIVWELQVDNFGGGTPSGSRPLSGPAYLRALDATDLSNVLYDTKLIGQRDLFGDPIKFTVPTVTNGHVLVGQALSFSVFGLFPTATALPAPPTDLAVTTGPGLHGPEIRLRWTNPAPNPGADPTGIKILRSTDGVNFTPLDTVFRTATSFTDTGPFQIGQRFYYRVVATNQLGDSVPSDTVSAVVPIPSPVLTLTGAGTSSVGLTWTAVGNDHYDIERSTDGVNFARLATVPAFQTSYTDTGLGRGIYTYRVHAFNTGPTAESLSDPRGEWVGPTLDHGAGFANATDLTTNGNTFVSPVEQLVRLTGANAQTGSAFSNGRIAIGRFTTSFQVRLHEGTQPDYADGFTFVIQANAPTALGQGGAGLGYQGVGRSVAVKFSTFQHAGDPSASSTGLVLNGANPGGGTDTTPSGVLLNSQDPKQIYLTYDGSTLTERIEDLLTMQAFTASFAVNVAAVIGSDTAYVGFTGASGTGSLWQLEDVLNWTFASQAAPPGAPTNLREIAFASTAIDLAWNSNSYNESGFQVERSTDGTNFTPAGATTARGFEDAGLGPGTYYYRVRAYDGTGLFSPYSAVVQVVLPGPLLTDHQDVGTPNDPAIPGSASFANGTYTLRASGSDIGAQADHFQFLYRPFLGDGEIIVRVVTVGRADFSTKAGVMFREDLTAGAKNALMFETPPPDHNTPGFHWRDQSGGASMETSGPGGQAVPLWVRLVRQGNTFAGYYAHDNGDGTHGTWVRVGTPQTIIMSPNVYVGLALTGHTNATTSTATFDHLQILPAVPQTTHLDVTADRGVVAPGVPVNVLVSTLDPFNNPVAGYRGTVHFTSSDQMTGLPTDYTFTAADNGRHTFTVILRTLGRQTVTATDTAFGVVFGGTAVAVSDGITASAFRVAGFPGRVNGGDPGTFSVTALDDQGNTLTGYRGTVHFLSSDPRALLPADYTFTAADAGTHAFQATFRTPGTQALTVSDPAAGVSGSQLGIVVYPAVPVATPVTLNAVEGRAFGAVPSFNGTDDYAQVPSSLVLGGAVTIEAWVKARNVFASWARVADFANGPGADNIIFGWYANTGRLYTETYVNGQSLKVIAPTVFPQNQWVHVAMVNDGSGQGFIYVNGVLIASGPQFVPATVTRSQQYLARSNYAADAFFRGSLEEVHVWNAARSADQILADMGTLAGDEPGLVAYYPLDEAGGTTAFDRTVNGYDATLTSTRSGGHPTWVADAPPGRAVATFQVADPAARAADYWAEISWGDGHRSVALITPNGQGGFNVNGANTYVEEGTYPVRVLILDRAGRLVVVTSTAVVTDPPVTAQGGFTVTAVAGTDSGVQTVATFADPGAAEALADYSATIDWGDNNSSPGVISGPVGGTFTVRGSHTYSQPGNYTVIVTIRHDTAPDAAAVSAAVVSDPGGSPVGGGFRAPWAVGVPGKRTDGNFDVPGEPAADGREVVRAMSLMAAAQPDAADGGDFLEWGSHGWTSKTDADAIDLLHASLGGGLLSSAGDDVLW